MHPDGHIFTALSQGRHAHSSERETLGKSRTALSSRRKKKSSVLVPLDFVSTKEGDYIDVIRESGMTHRLKASATGDPWQSIYIAGLQEVTRLRAHKSPDCTFP